MDDPASLGAIVLWLISVTITWMMAAAERLFSVVSRSTLEKLVDRQVPHAERLLKLYSDSVSRRRLEIMPVVGRGFAGALGTGAAIFLASRLVGESTQTWSVVAMGATAALVVYLLAWLLPARTMIHDDIERQVSRLGGPLWTLYGLSFLLTAPIEVLLPQPKKNPEQMEAERAEFKARIEDDSDDGVIEAEKADMIHSIISLPDTMVKEVMVPRVGMACFDKDDGFEELVRFMASSRHTRIPIYQDTVDNILGVVHAKDVLQHTIKRDDDSPSVDALIRDGFVLFVPENKHIDELLRQFRLERKHLAIVVDEYGGTAGLVTLEDLLEEIVGEIRDEYDEGEESEWVWEDEKTIVIDGGAAIARVNEETDAEIPEDDGYDTIAGFLYQSFGAIPEPQDAMSHGRWQLVVEEVTGQRINKVRMTKTPNGSNDDKNVDTHDEE